MSNIIRINNTDIAVKEYHGQRVVTLKEIDQCHERPEGTARKRFNDNRARFIEGTDYFVRNSDEAMQEYGIVAPNGLTLITKNGYLMLVKSLQDDLAWDVQRMLVDTYFCNQPDYSNLSTQLQQAAMMLQAMANVEIEQKRQSAQLAAVNNRIDNIGDLIALNPVQWRKEVPHLVAKIAQRMGGQEHIRNVYEEAYKLLDDRAGCSVQTRLTNLRQRMAAEGECKSKRDRTTKMDVIEKDKRLTEIFLSVIKELAIREGVTLEEAPA